MTTMNCPYCHIKTSITARGIPGADESGRFIPARCEDNHGYFWSLGECNSCTGIVMFCETKGWVFPTPFPTPTASEIPKDIRRDLDEAKQCMSVDSLRATVVMCRRALQMACIDKGANAGDNLVAQINQLKANSVITADLHEWATVVRWVGNDGAHPGGAEVDKEDAENMLDLTEQFLHVLYVAPAKAAAHRAKLGK